NISPDGFPLSKKTYHHGNLAESLLDAVDDIATRFGLEAVTLRSCAKQVGVSPSAAFRHYADKRALMTAFATRALEQLSASLSTAKTAAEQQQHNAFESVTLAYVAFALDKPAFFRAMWREEGIYIEDEAYACATRTLQAKLHSGFADTLEDTDAQSLSATELLAWSSVHGLASLMVEGTVAKGKSRSEQLEQAQAMIAGLLPLTGATDRSH
ncbi:MAG: TetR/AcrR family transcriptional regulator, partial [Pseudomonadota bacterium]